MAIEPINIFMVAHNKNKNAEIQNLEATSYRKKTQRSQGGN